MNTPTPNLDGLYQDMAGRFGALSQLFSKLDSPKAVQKLLDGLTAPDGKDFQPFVDGLDVPLLGKCYWLREVIERVVSTPAGFVKGDCWLRDNLTQQERVSYLRILLKYRQLSPVDPTKVPTFKDGHYVVPPGPFLDELKANGLVQCERDHQTYDSSIVAVLSRPERVCL